MPDKRILCIATNIIAKPANNFNIIKDTLLFDNAITMLDTIRPAFENLAAATASDLTGLANLTSLQHTNRPDIFQLKAELAESKLDLAHMQRDSRSGSAVTEKVEWRKSSMSITAGHTDSVTTHATQAQNCATNRTDTKTLLQQQRDWEAATHETLIKGKNIKEGCLS